MKIIFYAPYNMSENQEFSLDRAPRIRCYNIYKYLRKKCEVVLVCGDAKERKKKYKILLKSNLKGIDGFYMERPNCSLKYFDIDFLKKINEYKVPMSMFYRDIHWKFPVFSKTVYQRIKFRRKFNKSTKQFQFYKNYFDHIYSPTKEFAEFAKLDPKCLLPPAGEITNLSKEKNIGILFSGSQKSGFDKLLIANELLLKKGYDIPFYIIMRNFNFTKPSNFKVYHVLTDKIFKKVHIGIIPLNPTDYYKMAFSLKFMQYLSNGLPVICQQLPAFVRFNDQYNVCKFFNGTSEDLAKKIEYLVQNKITRIELSKNAMEAIKNRENWQQRVDTIINDLSIINKGK